MPFNPYLRWLGIRGDDLPPNHYRLLGIEPLESAPDVIATAADRQMAHVRKYQNGPHSALSQRLLNELATAKLCLLDPSRKAAYDDTLATEQAVTDDPDDEAAAPVTVATSTYRQADSAGAGKPKRALLLMIAAVAIVLFIVAFVFQNMQRPVTVKLPAPPAASPRKVIIDPPIKAKAPEEPVVADETTPTAPVKTVPTEELAIPSTVDLEADPMPTSDPAVATNPATPSPTETEGEDSPPEILEPAPRTIVLPPIPTESELEKTRSQFSDVYAARIEEALAAAEPLALSKLSGDLYQRGLHTRSNPFAQYVLLSECLELAIYSGNSAVADQAAREITLHFDVDPVTARLRSAERVGKTIGRLKNQPSAAASVRFCEAVMPIFELAIARDDFEQANALLKLLSIAARRCRSTDSQHATNVESARETWKRRRREYADVQTAHTLLAELTGTPNGTSDSETRMQEASWTIGRYHGLLKGDLKMAAPFLIQSNHAELSRLATLEQAAAEPASLAADQLFELAQGWHEFAKEERHPSGKPISDTAKRTALKQSQKWFADVMPSLVGLEREEAKQKLKDAKEQLAFSAVGPPIPEHAAIFDGRQSFVTSTVFRYDGKRPLAIQAIVKPKGPTASFGVSGTLVGNANTDSGFSLYAESGYWTFRFATTLDRDLRVRIKSRLTPNRWTRLLAVYDGAQILIQQDDRPEIRAETHSKHQVAAIPLTIGASASVAPGKPRANLFRGDIAALHIYYELPQHRPVFEFSANTHTPGFKRTKIESY